MGGGLSRAIFVSAFGRAEEENLTPDGLGDAGIRRDVSAADRILVEYPAGMCGRLLRRLIRGRPDWGTAKRARHVSQHYAQDQKDQERDEKLANEGGDHAIGAKTVGSSPGYSWLTFSSWGSELQELLSDLAAQRCHYEVAVQVIQYAFPPTPGLIPPTDYICSSVNDYNVVLARTDLPSWIFQWSNPQSGQFVNELVLPTPIGPVPLPRSWASVDAQFFGHSFLYINTHLESFDANIRELQGGELRAGPANSTLPVIIGMDSNAQAFPLPQDPTYVDFISAGYNDVWSQLFPKLPGLTCCQDEADNNPVSELYQRIDLVLTHGNVIPWGAALIGADAHSRLPDGLWPSDHAALVAGVLVGGH